MQMADFYAALDGFLLAKEQEDSRAAYYTTWLLSTQAGKEFDFEKVYKAVFEGLHPPKADALKSGKDEFLKAFGVGGDGA